MESTGPTPRRWIRTVLIALGCFLAVFGAKSAYVDRFASDIPNWDQWDAESEYMLVPWKRGEFRAADLLRPHNEHRIVPTKLLALGLFLANGQWDARLECVANAALQALLALAVFLGGRRLIEPRWQVAWLVAVLATFAAPMSWQNLTSGFHTQQTFLLGFSLAAIHLLVTGNFAGGRWWAGIACALVSLVTMGSGLLTAVAAGATLVFTTPPRELARRHGVTLALLVVIALLGWFTRIEVSYHDPLKAHSPGAFLLCFWRSLQWPVVGFPLYPLFGWAPFAWLAWRVWRAGPAAPAGERVLLGVGVWVLLQYLASAYARGGPGDWPANRYFDTVALGIAVNLLALLVAWSWPAPAGWQRRLRAAATAAGLALLAHGWWAHIDDTINSAGPWLARGNVEKEGLTRAYLRTGDEAHLRAGTIPYPSLPVFIQRISHPEIREVLPACVRAPLPLATAAGTTGPFSAAAIATTDPAPFGWPAFGSHTAAGDAATGEWRSEWLPPGRSAFWALPVYSTRPGSSLLDLRLVDASGGAVTVVLPGDSEPLPVSTWRLAVIPAPRVPTQLVARDGLGDGWLAFGAPVEMPAGSHRARQLAALGLPLFWCGLAAVAFAGAAARGPAFADAWRREAGRVRALPRWRTGLAAALGAAAAGFAVYQLAIAQRPAFFEARVSGDLHKRSMELFYDRGRGIRGGDAVQVWFEENEKVRHLHLRIPAGRLRALRVDPMDHGATLTIENARIVDVNGAILRELPPSLFVPNAEVARIVSEGNRLEVTSIAGALDSQLKVALDPPVSTRPVVSRAWPRVFAVLVAALAGALLGPSLLERLRHLPAAVALEWRELAAAMRAGRAPAPGAPAATEPVAAVRPATILLVALALVALLVWRKTDSFTNPQFWAEDSSLFYMDVERFGVMSLVRPYAGYLHTIPRLGALAAGHVDAGRLPAAFIAVSALIALGCILHLFSPRVRLPCKPLLAAIAFVVPHTGEVYLNVTNTQWFTALLLLQFLFKDGWTNRRQQVTDIALLALAGLSGTFAVLFLPAFAWRAWRRRDGAAATSLGVVGACALAQLSSLLQDQGAMRQGIESVDVVSLLGVIGRRWVFSWLSASHVPPGDSRWLVAAVSFLALGILFAAGLRRSPYREQKLLLWSASAVLLAAAWYRTRFDRWAFDDLVNGDRYLFVPKVVLGWLIALEAAEAGRSRWAARTVFVVMLAVNLPTLRIAPQPDYAWQTHCDALRRGVKADIPTPPAGWIFNYPGRSP